MLNSKRIASSQRPASQPLPRNKRVRYTAHACTECQRRKIKCTGEKPCMNCVTSGTTCQYSQSMQRGRPRRNKPPMQDNISSGEGCATGSHIESSVVLRLRLLEDEIRSLRESHNRLDSSGLNAQNTPPDASGPSPGSSTPNHSPAPASVAPRLHTHSSSPHEAADHQESGMIPSCISPRDINIATFETSPPPNVRMEKIPGEHDREHRSQSISDDAVEDPNQIHCLLRFNTELESNMHLFFNEFDYWLPCVRKKEIWPRLLHIFQTSAPRSDGILVQLDGTTNAHLLALVCTIMAVSEFLKVQEYLTQLDKSRNCGSHSHEIWYAESVKLMGRASHERPNMDSLRQSLLAALYHLMLDRLHESSQAIARAVDIAYVTDLNNEICWAGFSEDDRFSRRMLWWTLYLFDRRVARKLGRPYYIQDRYTSVSDFSSSVSPHPESGLGDKDSIQYYQHSGKTCTNRTFDWCWIVYLQFHVEWSRLCTKVWDTLYSMCAPHTGDESHIESLDAMVVRLRRNLPPLMIWDTSALSSESDTFAWNPMSRLQLVIFTRINLLRLWIRHSSISRYKSGLNGYLSEADVAHSIKISQDLVCSTIHAVTTYMEVRLYQRPFATFATISLMESLHHLLSLPSHALESEDVQKAFTSARNCLHLMSTMGITSAQNSIKSQTDTLSQQGSLAQLQMPGSAWFDFPLSEPFRPPEIDYAMTGSGPNNAFSDSSPLRTFSFLDASQAVVW